MLDIKILTVTEEYFLEKYGQDYIEAACPDKFTVEVLKGVSKETLAHEIAHALDEEGVGIFSACGKYPFWRDLHPSNKSIILAGYPAEMRKFEAFGHYVQQTPILVSLIVRGLGKPREQLIQALFDELDNLFA